MKAAELARLSLKDLRALRERVDAAIAEREVEERAEVKAKVAELAAQSGFSIGELFGTKRGRGAVVVKYRNPKDPKQTWTGRGRRPNWLVEAGGNAERFRV